MEVRREDPQTVAISGLNLLLCELLQQIPVSAEPEGDAAAEARLFPSPMAGDAESDFRADWQEYVQPGLRQLFESALETVRRDLADFPPAEPALEHTLRIPVAHLEKWLNALNQARLALAARHNVTERDMDRVPREGSTRDLAIFQIHLYGLLQEWFLRELEA